MQGTLQLLDTQQQCRPTEARGNKSRLQMVSKLLNSFPSAQKADSITDFLMTRSCCSLEQSDAFKPYS